MDFLSRAPRHVIPLYYSVIGPRYNLTTFEFIITSKRKVEWSRWKLALLLKHERPSCRVNYFATPVPGTSFPACTSTFSRPLCVSRIVSACTWYFCDPLNRQILPLRLPRHSFPIWESKWLGFDSRWNSMHGLRSWTSVSIMLKKKLEGASTLKEVLGDIERCQFTLTGSTSSSWLNIIHYGHIEL